MPALHTDLAPLLELRADLEGPADTPATIAVVARSLPGGARFGVAAGLEDVIEDLLDLRFAPDDLRWIRDVLRFPHAALERLASFRFDGHVEALPEGAVFLPGEPLLRLTAPRAQARFVRGRIVQRLLGASHAATRATRRLLAAHGALLVDDTLHYQPAALHAERDARAAWIAGYHATTDAEAARRHGLPVVAILDAASWTACCPTDRALLRLGPGDAGVGVRQLVERATAWRAGGVRLGGAVVDRPDAMASVRLARGALDDAGFWEVSLFAGGAPDEHDIAALLATGAPVEGFIVDASPRPGESPGDFEIVEGARAEAPIPVRDLALDWPPAATLRSVVRDGRRSCAAPSLAASRETAAHARRALPPALRSLADGPAAPRAFQAGEVIWTERPSAHEATGAPRARAPA
jgi:nicotinate phosphoribosyltransferase